MSVFLHANVHTQYFTVMHLSIAVLHAEATEQQVVVVDNRGREQESHIGLMETDDCVCI